MRRSKMQYSFILRIDIKFTVMLIWLQGRIYCLLIAHSEQSVPDPNSQRVWDNEMSQKSHLYAVRVGPDLPKTVAVEGRMVLMQNLWY